MTDDDGRGRRLGPLAWSWPGFVATIVAVLVAGGWATALVISATPWTDRLSEGGAALLNTIGGVLAGGVAAYLGSHHRDHRDGSDDDAR